MISIRWDAIHLEKTSFESNDSISINKMKIEKNGFNFNKKNGNNQSSLLKWILAILRSYGRNIILIIVLEKFTHTRTQTECLVTC